MKTAIRYFTRSGNTQKLAEAIGGAIDTPALPITSPISEEVDLLFLGGSVYAFGIDETLKAFIEALDASLVKKVAVFSTAAMVPSAYPHIQKLLEQKGIPVAPQEFHCRGRFAMVHKNRPNEKDCAAAAAFAQQLIK